MLYVHDCGDHLISHDGFVALGIHHMTLAQFMKLQRADYLPVYWHPDPFGIRYKRTRFQEHERKAGGKDIIESRPRDFPDEGGGRGLLPGQSG
jgi:hypothetical protein